MSEVAPTLKCVVAWSDRRNLCSLVADALAARFAPDDILPIGDDSLVVYGAADPSELRDCIAAVIEEDESALVVEFERWSSFGAGVDAAWLLRRGH